MGWRRRRRGRLQKLAVPAGWIVFVLLLSAATFWLVPVPSPPPPPVVEPGAIPVGSGAPEAPAAAPGAPAAADTEGIGELWQCEKCGRTFTTFTIHCWIPCKRVR